jgi:hypothetical protein
MKKTLLSLAFLGAIFSADAQQLLPKQDFESLTIGNVGTDLTASTPGQGGWLTGASNGAGTTTTTNRANSNFQIVASDVAHGKAFQLTGVNGDKGNKGAWLSTAWSSRTLGNDITQLDFEFFTGPATTSKNGFNIVLYDNTYSEAYASFNIDLFGKDVYGVAYYDAGAGVASNTVDLGFTAGTLAVNTWYTFGVSYNKTTGEVIWRAKLSGSGNPIIFTKKLTTAAIGKDLVEYDIETANIDAGNNVAAVALFDNISLLATNSDTLESIDFISSKFSVSPNPASHVVNITNADNMLVNNVTVTDLNGRTVKNVSFEGVANAQVNVADLASGLYIMNVTSDKGTATKKFVKN